MTVINSAHSILSKENTTTTTTIKISEVAVNYESEEQQSQSNYGILVRDIGYRSNSRLNRRYPALYEQSYLASRSSNHQYLLTVVKSTEKIEEPENRSLTRLVSSFSLNSYKIHQIIGEFCMTPDQGQKVYRLIYPKLIANRPVELDFTGVKICIPPFLNFALGQLFKDIQPDTLNHLLKISNLNPISQQTLQLVMENAKCYYSDENLRQSVDRVLTEQSVSL
ncbi:MAG: STAS-like domain-containing protein [Planktothrix sp.]|uniref:STAS-like domain-containing protein n=1 Tax=unclassified Planktothrix TaxID=2648599 RepID=UPI001F54F378|nr:STAS-like domain-containing protein [Planktothrix sp. FACHB-1365]